MTNLEVCPVCGSHRKGPSGAFRDVRLSVLMPVYNEVGTIETIIERVRRVDIPKEIIIVDDGSTDGTADLLRKLTAEQRESFDGNIKLLTQSTNQGKGAAIARAAAAAEGDIAIIQDADLEYDPNEYYRILLPIVENDADVVYGSRFLGGSPHRVLYFWHAMGNRLITLLSNMFTNLNLTDVETGYKAFRTELLRAITIQQKGFGFEIEITSKVARRGSRVYEVGISYFGRTYEQGKKITWRDGLKSLFLILKYR